jgi:quercetin dioxygenase-like cupin family protein
MWAALPLALGCVAPQGTAVVEKGVPRRAETDGRQPVSVTPLHASDDQTVNLLRIDGVVPPHRHLHSEETIYIIAGKGTLFLDDGQRDLEAGDLVVVPRNTPHGFVPLDGPAVVLSIFAPALREGDRVPEPR